MHIISGSLGGRILKTMDLPGCRPAMSKVREAIFSMLEARGVVWTGTRVLDLYAGTGSIGFEAISRGADLTCFVECDKQAAACIEENIGRFGLSPDQANIRLQRVEHFLRKRNEEPFDVIFVDPPYRTDLLRQTLHAILKGGWIAAGGMLVAEVEADLKLSEQPALLQLMDRRYGQTRILIWTLPANI